MKEEKMSWLSWILTILLRIIIILALCAGYSFVLMLLWNSVLVAVLPFYKVSFLQAVGIYIISNLLFGDGIFLPGDFEILAGDDAEEVEEDED